MRKLQTNPNRTKTYTIAAIGDSQTDFRASIYGVNPSDMWLPQLANMLANNGALIQARGFGVSGNTTTQILARFDIMFLYETPDLAIIYAGVNDPGASISAATTQANFQAMIKALKYRCVGFGAGLGLGVSVATQNDLPANGFVGQRFVVMADTSATGGIVVATSQDNSKYNTTITGNYSSSAQQTVWEFRNSQTGEAGWGRVATSSTPAFSDGVQRIVTVGSNYLNYTTGTTGADTYNPNTQSGTQNSSYLAVRNAVQAATTAELVGNAGKVVYCDLYLLQALLIFGGTFQGKAIASITTLGSGSWHYIPTNQHHNQLGQWSVALANYYTILAQTGWLSALSI